MVREPITGTTTERVRKVHGYGMRLGLSTSQIGEIIADLGAYDRVDWGPVIDAIEAQVEWVEMKRRRKR